MEIYDYVPLHTVEEQDQILIDEDPVEVLEKVDSGDSILIRGISYTDGDTVTYILNAHTEVGLWTA
jgi:hypothetical protein